jgi:pyruvate dehydrogenase E2 component (dihydrolipoamide acetyltransferase)
MTSPDGPSRDAVTELRMPSLGADMERGTLVLWKVKPGDTIKRGDIVAEVETEKGVFEMEADGAGVVAELLVAPGTRTLVGAPLARLTSGRAIPPAAAAPAPAAPRASPAARRLAAERGIELGSLVGTGPDHAIVLADVESAIAALPARAPVPPPPAPVVVPPAPAIPAAAPARPPPPASAEAARAMRQAVAAAVSRSKREIPHYYLSADVDLSKALAWLAEANGKRPIAERVVPAVLLVKSVAVALRSHPDLNAAWADGALQLRESINLGIAVSMRGGGLITPAIHHTDTLPLDTLMAALSDLVRRARTGGLRTSEMTDATITVSNLGDEGVTSLFGIIYPPQVALVGFGSIAERPWAEHGALSVRHVVTVTLAADHRATDGHYGSRFLRQIARLLQTPEVL